ncbi:hypothetical protein P9104_08815 [Gallibacterium anatis]
MTTQNKVMKTKNASPAQVLRDFFEKPTATQCSLMPSQKVSSMPLVWQQH